MTGWVVLGAHGMLGADLVPMLRAAGREVTGFGRADCDITSPASVRAAVADADIVVNCAAYTKVDEAESDEATALTINGVGPGVVAAACAVSGAQLVHVSTDYVFPGDATTPYDEDAPTGPRSAYGRTKLAGEQAVVAALPDRSWIVRTAWLYGAYGPNFVATMRRLEARRDTVDVVDDQRGQPTWTVDLAAQILALVAADAPGGIYHGTSSGETTWHGLAREVFTLAGADASRVHPTTSAAFVRPAKRPAYSVLGHRRWAEAGVAPMRDWRSALCEAWASLP
ncbi:MAG: dTDP-4-dehydrorhamnose reductase [Frankiaceae bacterium]|nr:dTDP-4-dehydrorhamnose reductase [Frankiaceae bacterium]